MRVLVILAMIWQPLVLAVATHRSAPVPFSDTSCSAMVAETSCCDSTPVASLCPPPIDPCLCGVQPDEIPKETPDAPLPRSDRDTVVTIPSHVIAILVITLDEPQAVAPRTGVYSLHTNNTHNQVQAYLGIWQT